MRITSPKNPRVKNVIRLRQRRHRDAQQRTVVEGLREIRLALEAGVIPLEAFVCPERLDAPEARSLLGQLERLAQEGPTRLYQVTPEVFARLAYREESGGLLLVIPYLERSLADLPLGEPPFLAVVEGAEKPGNLGAILRTGDAAGVDGLILCGGTDVHNPNVIRASLGAVFTVPVAQVASGEAIAWLQKKGVAILAATPEGDVLYTEADLTGPVAIVTGSEAHGLSRPWLQAAARRITIPMFGKVDSLNLSAATAVLLYEVVRQRGLAPGP